MYHPFIIAAIKHKQLPAIEAVVKDTSSGTNQLVQPISVLVLCPTRELASQLAAEAISLLKYHDGIGVQTLVGGTRFKLDQKRLESNPCQVCRGVMVKIVLQVHNVFRKLFFSTEGLLEGTNIWFLHKNLYRY